MTCAVYVRSPEWFDGGSVSHWTMRLIFNKKLNFNSRYRGKHFRLCLSRLCRAFTLNMRFSILINNVASSRHLNIHFAFALSLNRPYICRVELTRVTFSVKLKHNNKYLYIYLLWRFSSSADLWLHLYLITCTRGEERRGPSRHERAMCARAQPL